MRIVTTRFIILCLTLFVFSPLAWSKPDKSSEGTSENCFDPADKRDIRLWNGDAPGAAGRDPCRDIPYLRVFPASGSKNNENTAILVIPGGGYDHLTNTKEQTPVGEYFSSTLNATTFVLYYRLVSSDGTYRYPVPMWDGQRALKLIKAHAREYGIAPDRVGLFGFSAGGHLATMLAEHSATDFDLTAHDSVDAVSGRVSFLGLGYPVISMDPDQFGNSNSREHLLTGYDGRALKHLDTYLSGQDNVAAHTPPVFLFASKDDQRINPQNSIMLAAALKSANVPAEVHLFEHGAHGVGLAKNIPEESQWPEFFRLWLARQGLIE